MSGSVCVDHRKIIPNSIMEAYVEPIHAKTPGSLGKTNMALPACFIAIHTPQCFRQDNEVYPKHKKR